MAKNNPYFKFDVNQWITGDITSQSDALQGFFIRFCAYYWSQDCNVSYAKASKKFKKMSLQKLINASIIKRNDDELHVNFLDNQYEVRSKLSKKNATSGKVGGEKSGESRGYVKQNEALASTQRSQGEKRREDNKEIREDGEKTLASQQTNFFRIREEVFLMKPSEYFITNLASIWEHWVRLKGQEFCAAASKKLDNDYFGHMFNDVMHIKNSFVTCCNKLEKENFSKKKTYDSTKINSTGGPGFGKL